MTIQDLIQKWEDELALLKTAYKQSLDEYTFTNITSLERCLEELREAYKEQDIKHWAKPYKAALDKC